MVLHVLSIDNPQENEDLRSKSESVTDAMVSDKTYSMLAAKLLATVQAPEYDGVGITAFNGEMIPGPEGCLSVPEKRGQVERYRDIEISYISPHTLKDTTERVTGFTAVIFQHECDHLDGIVYVDKGFDIKDIDE